MKKNNAIQLRIRYNVVDKIKNHKGDIALYTAILAKYENDLLLDMRIVPVDFDNKKEQTVSVPAEWKKEKNIKFKAFLWNSLSEMSPECAAAELQKTQAGEGVPD